jgi:hypothetical protein
MKRSTGGSLSLAPWPLSLGYDQDRASPRAMTSMMPQRPTKATSKRAAKPAATLDPQVKHNAPEITANNKGSITYCHMRKSLPLGRSNEFMIGYWAASS